MSSEAAALSVNGPRPASRPAFKRLSRNLTRFDNKISVAPQLAADARIYYFSEQIQSRLQSQQICIPVPVQVECKLTLHHSVSHVMCEALGGPHKCVASSRARVPSSQNVRYLRGYGALVPEQPGFMLMAGQLSRVLCQFPVPVPAGCSSTVLYSTYCTGSFGIKVFRAQRRQLAFTS